MNREIDAAQSECFCETLATYAVRTPPTELPAGALAHAADAFVNWVGCALGGAHHPTVDRAADAFRSITQAGPHRALGRGDHHGIVEVVSLDCLSSAVLAYDDTHIDTVLHPTGPVAAALLGIARERAVSGEEFLAALSIGMEVECRVGLSFTAPGAGGKQGWYATGVAGGIGAAAASGRLLGFDTAKTKHAIGIAAARASGNRGTHGSMTGNYVPSLAAESGYISAKMAAAGFECGTNALDGPNGLLQLIAERPAIDRALEGLGTVSEAARTAFKPYPSGIVTHPVIDACRTLMSDHDVTAADIESVSFDVAQTAMNLGGKRRPQDLYAAQVSLSFWAAGTLLCGTATVELMHEGALKDHALLDMEDRLSFEVDRLLELGQCRAAATLKDGRSLTVHIAHVTGSPQRPMTSADVDAKFLSLATPGSTHSTALELLSRCRSVNRAENVATHIEV
jgi:2-methylcitrate dehydratase PrpD